MYRGFDSDQKITIYVPERIGRALENDAEQFEIFKKNRTDLNMNEFLSRVVLGYYQVYKQEWNYTAVRIKEVLREAVPADPKREELTKQLMNQVILPEVPKRKGKNPRKFSLKPTSRTKDTLEEIDANLTQDDYISQYLCRMLISYCQKPTYERERIIFREHVEFLERAIRLKKEIVFTLTEYPKSSDSDKSDYAKRTHYAIPYALHYGKEEMYNYLLCQENGKAGNIASTYRLCRLKSVSGSSGISTLDSQIVERMEEMKRKGPQFVIRDDEETLVRLTKQGRVSFRMIYFNRPRPDSIEEKENGSAIYHFRASRSQLFLYFRRFNPGEAEVLQPQPLRDEMIQFFQESLKAYAMDAEEP